MTRVNVTAIVIGWSKYRSGKPPMQWMLGKLQCIWGSLDWFELESFFKATVSLPQLQQQTVCLL